MLRIHPSVLMLALALSGCGSDGARSDGSADGTPAFDGGAPSLPLAELASGCIRASACGVKTYPTLANCIDAYFDLHRSQGLGQIYDKIYRCVNAAAGDCAKTKVCFDQRGPCDSSYKASCDGKTAVSCDLIDQRVYALDCALAGMECLIRSGQTTSASCTPGVCYSTFGTVCQGSRLITCVSGVSESEDCAVDGLACHSKTPTSAVCVGEQSTTCSAKTFSPSCAGSTAVTCVEGRVHRDDCTRYKMRHTRCEAAACVVAGSACDYALNRCAGAELEACLDGAWQRFDCLKLGLGACKPSGSAANCDKPSG